MRRRNKIVVSRWALVFSKKKTTYSQKKTAGIDVPNKTNSIIGEIRLLIESARERVASFANAQLTMLYWRVGERIYREILNKERAEYGSQILSTLSAELIPVYGDGFSERNLARMVKFAEYFPQEQIVVTLF